MAVTKARTESGEGKGGGGGVDDDNDDARCPAAVYLALGRGRLWVR